MKQEKIECKVPSNIKAEINSNKALMGFKTIGEYITFSHQTIRYISSVAEAQGIKPSEIPEVTDWLLDTINLKHCIKMLVESWQIEQEALHKD